MPQTTKALPREADDRSPFGPTPGPGELALIRPYLLGDVPPEALYARRVALANDAVDRTWETIPKAFLHRLAATLPGKSLLSSHDKNQFPHGLWYAASVRPSRADEPGEHTLEAAFYLVKTPENQELRDKIDAGVVRHISIGFRYDTRTCSVCGGDYETCPHLPGERLGDNQQTATFAYSGDPQRYEATEASLVFLGAQRGSLITKDSGQWSVASDQKLATQHSSLATRSATTMDLDQALETIKTMKHQAAAAKNAQDAAEKDRTDKREATELELAKARAENAALKAPDEARKELLSDGLTFREHLKAEITRMAGLLKRETQTTTLLSLAGAATATTLKGIYDEYAREVEEKFPPRPIGNPMSTDKADAAQKEAAQASHRGYTVL